MVAMVNGCNVNGQSAICLTYDDYNGGHYDNDNENCYDDDDNDFDNDFWWFAALGSLRASARMPTFIIQTDDDNDSD